ncbi:Pkinase-domain-containing protein [Clavulina sp. PMI_390]|nr:Pkinase-domain-containing protein [Clavulina sp. PMI_390]
MAHLLEALKEKALDAFSQLNTVLCCQSTAKIKIGGRSYIIVKVLGEGGFSFVYLAQDAESGRELALKKIRCPTGSEGVKEAMREVEAYRRFRHPNIIHILESFVVQDPDGDGQIVYLLLPLYRRGNLQDIMNSNSINGTHTPEKRMLELFHGACLAVRAMHTYRPKAKQGSSSGPSGASSLAPGTSMRPPSRGRSPAPDGDHEHDAHELHGLLGGSGGDRGAPEDDLEGGEGYSYPQGGSIPQAIDRARGAGAVVFDGDEEAAAIADSGEGAGEVVPYAHRDIKPANIMIDDNGNAILMDFGSATKARVHIANRQQALTQQDIAAEQSTMPYRAPELFDVKTGTTLDEKVDIWSLGCTLFAVAYGHSPFETSQTLDQGGSLAMAVMNGTYKHPTGRGAQYSEGLKRLIDIALIVDPAQRCDIHQLIDATEKVLRTLD